MRIPHRRLSPDALRGVIEAYVTRAGTDDGVQDVPFATKVFQVQQHLKAGTAVLVYDEDTDSCTIQPADQLSGYDRSGSLGVRRGHGHTEGPSGTLRCSVPVHAASARR
jgi:uncharacterized protein YheU (UPF0270 family)